MKNFFFSIITILLVLSSCTETEPVLKIGLVADPQYANKPTKGKRHYSESLIKLEEAIDTFNYNKVDFVQNLGDIIDGNWESYNSIIPVYNKLNPDIENYQLLGNHDFAIDTAHMKDILDIFSMPNFYYSYSKKGWKFIVLDASDYSYYANILHKRDTNQMNVYFENTKENPNNYRGKSAIGKEQQEWLKQELASAIEQNQKVILFSHLPIKPYGNNHNLWNDHEIVNIIENNSNVVAFINGHNHSGGYVFENGKHYITICAMVDTELNSYGILEVYTDSLVLKGYGNQKTYHLKND